MVDNITISLGGSSESVITSGTSSSSKGEFTLLLDVVNAVVALGEIVVDNIEVVLLSNFEGEIAFLFIPFVGALIDVAGPVANPIKSGFGAKVVKIDRPDGNRVTRSSSGKTTVGTPGPLIVGISNICASGHNRRISAGVGMSEIMSGAETVAFLSVGLACVDIDNIDCTFVCTFSIVDLTGSVVVVVLIE